ncbi:hypothetical protein HPB49_017247 [Dermacentor silvarum]|uniref:Uncharacterized protein n=1 Tax=Dermacentor silvarum TaxID=543639 RepID=A0ACB8C4L1_DERSI|nr:hypothetical protein HPB49_017247 [Dermacentor silvarum]
METLDPIYPSGEEPRPAILQGDPGTFFMERLDSVGISLTSPRLTFFRLRHNTDQPIKTIQGADLALVGGVCIHCKGSKHHLYQEDKYNLREAVPVVSSSVGEGEASTAEAAVPQSVCQRGDSEWKLVVSKKRQWKAAALRKKAWSCDLATDREGKVLATTAAKFLKFASPFTAVISQKQTCIESEKLVYFFYRFW